MDINGDGRVDFNPTSPESAFARDETIVFRLVDHYLSTERVEPERLRFTLRLHTAAEYTRIELTPGSTVPDFPFTGLDGKPRRLADYRGKHGFWTSGDPGARPASPTCRTCRRCAPGFGRRASKFWV